MSLRKRLERLEAGTTVPERRTVIEYVPFEASEPSRIWCNELEREVTRSELEEMRETTDLHHIRIKYVNERPEGS